MGSMQNIPQNLKYKEFDFNFHLQEKGLCLPLFPERILLLNFKTNAGINNNMVKKEVDMGSIINKEDGLETGGVMKSTFPLLNVNERKDATMKSPNLPENCVTWLKLEMQPPTSMNQGVSGCMVKVENASEKKPSVVDLETTLVNVTKESTVNLREKYRKFRKAQNMKVFKRMSLLSNKNLTKSRKPLKCKFSSTKEIKPIQNGELNLPVTVEQNFILSCRFCKKSFKTFTDHHSHICNKSDNTNGEMKHKCNLCSMVFKYKNYLDRHMKGHNRNNCKICSAQFTKRKALCKHLKVVHNITEPEKLYNCSFCGKTFNKRPSLNAHLKSHADGKLLCMKCGFMCASESSYIEHAKQHIRYAKFECVLCGQKFVRRQQHDQHMMLHEKYSCPSCDVTFATKKLLLKHEQSIHGVDVVKKHACSICKKSFMRPIHLRKHLRIHTGEKPVKCAQCEKNFSDKRSLMKHLKTARHLQNVNDGKVVEVEKPFLCSICGATFFRQQSLLRHVEIIHTPGEAFKCSQCDYSTKCKANLKRHQEGHTNIKRYVCEICGASFRALATLKEHHAFVHSERRSFVCEKCNKGFKNKSGLQRHLRIHSEIRPYKCHCNRDYKRLSHLKRHMVSAHRMTIKRSFDNKRIEISDIDAKSNAAILLSVSEDTSKVDQDHTVCDDMSLLNMCNQNFLPNELFEISLNNDAKSDSLSKDSEKNDKYTYVPCQDVHEFLNKNEGGSTSVNIEKNPLISDVSHTVGFSESGDSLSLDDQGLNLSPDNYFSFSSSASPSNAIEVNGTSSSSQVQAILHDDQPVPSQDINRPRSLPNLNFQTSNGDNFFAFPMRCSDLSASIPVPSFLLSNEIASPPIENSSSSKQLFGDSGDILALPLFATTQDASLTDCPDNFFASTRDNIWGSTSDSRLQMDDEMASNSCDKVSSISDFSSDLPSNSSPLLACNLVFPNDPLMDCPIDTNSFTADDFIFSLNK